MKKVLLISTTQIETAIILPFSRILLELGLQEDALRVNRLKQGATFFQGDERMAVFSIDKVRDTAQGLRGGFFISGVSQEELRSLVAGLPDPEFSRLPVRWFNTGSKTRPRGLPYIQCAVKEMERLFTFRPFAVYIKSRIFA